MGEQFNSVWGEGGERKIKELWSTARSEAISAEQLADSANSLPLELDLGAPYDSARIFAGTHYTVDGVNTLWCHQEQFYRWSGTHYCPVDEATLRAELYDFLDKAVTRTSNSGMSRFLPDQVKVTKVFDALRAAVHLESELAAPAWLDGNPPVENVKELLACQNGLLHLPTQILYPHDPHFWSHNVLNFEFDQRAQCDGWLRFLDQVFPRDLEARQAVQEMFGLCITDETRFQKAFLFVGPKRSGKGTIGRVLRGLLGPENCIGPTIAGFVRPFGMQSWIGKKVAVFSDARLPSKTGIVSERLLSVTGEDQIEIERKYLGAWNGILSTRVIVLTNEIPEFEDDSGALPGRFIVLEMRESFFGREDPDLTDKLLVERPGVLNWALAGWDSLRARRRFEQPASGREAVEALAIAASDIRAFVDDKCELGPDFEVEVSQLHATWKSWRGANGLRSNLAPNQFSPKLKAAYSQIEIERPRGEDPKRPRLFVGIRLKKKSVKPQASSSVVVPLAPKSPSVPAGTTEFRRRF